MPVGISGSLISGYYLEERLAESFPSAMAEATRDAGRRRLLAWWKGPATTLGPASSIRSIIAVAAEPLMRTLGFAARPFQIEAEARTAACRLDVPGNGRAGLLVTLWGEDLDLAWQAAVRWGVGLDASWCLAFNVRSLRLIDTARTFARRFLEFDLESVLDVPSSFAALWALCRADAFVPSPRPLIDLIVDEASRHAVSVCRSLKLGVLDALAELVQALARSVRAGHRSPQRAWPLDTVFDQALTIVYRLLFLLYAESRNLVPLWHPIYREAYTIEHLRTLAEQPTPTRGLWEAVQAISRLAHQGCRAGTLHATPFNGRLFSPRRAPLAESAVLDDGAVGRAILALSTDRQTRASGRARIAYRDLGVEQLGAVYETVLDYEPRLASTPAHKANTVSVVLAPGGGRRKSTGTFYTPRSITEFLVRQTLAPLVEGQSAEAVLHLRVLDPAMGSGAFLVAACRYLAGAYERALVSEGACHASDITESDRAGFRRLVAQRCLFGVDSNPMAVQLARLSIWLTTLAAERPLTFLDHHLVCGDSLVGASLSDLTRRPARQLGGRSRRPIGATLPLFGEELGASLREVVPLRLNLAQQPDDTPAIVRAKESVLADLESPNGALARWRAAADLWCACWFPDETVSWLSGQVFSDLSAAIFGRATALPPHRVREALNAVRDLAARRRFLHWTLAFPELFFASSGQPLENPGFDAVLSNPPWDMVRADSQDHGSRDRARREARQLVAFARRSRIYRASGRGHPNRFQLFTERILALTRCGGRIGLVLPWGFASDQGCSALRRHLIEHSDLNTLVGFDNADGLFPIHRSVRFLALTATTGRPTRRIRCRLGERDPHALDSIPDRPAESGPTDFPLVLSPALIERLSGPELAIPDLRTPLDLVIAERLATDIPPLASPSGWNVRFGRELNATDDRAHFRPVCERGLPVVEGKHVYPFRVLVDRCTWSIRPGDAAKLLEAARTFNRPRLAYRDVAGATNQLTLIAAIVPAGTVTTHTLFCLRTRLSISDQQVLCGLLNSYVANYLVRQRVTTHLGVATLSRLPVPRPPANSSAHRELAALAAKLAVCPEPDRDPAHARLQAVAALAYGVTQKEFAHVLSTFPLVAVAAREEAQRSFEQLSR